MLTPSNPNFKINLFALGNTIPAHLNVKKFKSLKQLVQHVQNINSEDGDELAVSDH